MDESPVESPVENVESQQAAGPTQYEQSRAAIERFLLRQRIAFRRLIRRAKRYAANYKKQQRGYYGNYLRFMLNDWYADRRNILRKSLGIGWWNVNRAQLLFAGILTVASILAWLAMLVQNNIMREQMRQTERTLKLTMLGQGACVSITTPTMEKLEAGKPPVIFYGLDNTGKAPAQILSLKNHAFCPKNSTELEAQLRNLDTQKGEEYKGSFVPPEVANRIDFKTALSRKDITAAIARAAILVVIIDVRYTDMYGTIGRSRQVFHYSLAVDEFLSHYHFGIMELKQRDDGK